MKTLFDKLIALINEHGIEKVLITLKDTTLIKASDEHLRGNEKKAREWKDIGNRIGRIKAK